MTKTRLIGWVAVGVCVLGYAAFVGVMFAARGDALDARQAVLFGAVAALIGETGLWIAAGCLGLTIFARRKVLFDRVVGRLRRRSAA